MRPTTSSLRSACSFTGKLRTTRRSRTIIIPRRRKRSPAPLRANRRLQAVAKRNEAKHTYNANPDSVRAAIDVLGGLRAAARARARRHGRGRARRGRRSTRRSAATRRSRASTGCISLGTLAAHRGARVRRRRRAPRLDRGGDRARAGPHRAQGDDARQGLALHADGARGRRTWPGRAQGARTDAARARPMARAGRARVQRLHLHHAARGARRADRARDLVRRRARR